MNISNRALRAWIAACVLLAGASTASAADPGSEAFYEPIVGQEGKDVVWVPTPQVLVEKMLDMARVTPKDFVMDLGSGDGRNIIAAAKRGARALGVEYNPDMVELSKRNAAKAGVGERAQFVQGDMYQADFSKANVLALFLLSSNLQVLRDKIFNLQPGTRVVLNTFGIPDWSPDEQTTLDNCTSWCTVMLNIVPAKIAGTWRTQNGAEMTLTQSYQMLSGSTKTADGQTAAVSGRLRGNDLTLSTGKQEFTGQVKGNVIQGTQRPVGGGAAQQVTLTRVN